MHLRLRRLSSEFWVFPRYSYHRGDILTLTLYHEPKRLLKKTQLTFFLTFRNGWCERRKRLKTAADLSVLGRLKESFSFQVNGKTSTCARHWRSCTHLYSVGRGAATLATWGFTLPPSAGRSRVRGGRGEERARRRTQVKQRRGAGREMWSGSTESAPFTRTYPRRRPEPACWFAFINFKFIIQIIIISSIIQLLINLIYQLTCPIYAHNVGKCIKS